MFPEHGVSSALDKIVTQVTISYLRPGLLSFLEAASQEFELMIYTSGTEDYARRILDQLDPKGVFFRHRLYRSSCMWLDSLGGFTKDLARFNRPMGRIVLVDDDRMNFVAQLQNGVPIKAFYDDENDTALTALGSLLQRIKNEPDVRPFLTRSFNLENLLRDDREKLIG
jgi:CTD small phosphatase-like protein 2